MTSAGAAIEHCTKTGSISREFFQSEHTQTKFLLICDVLQCFDRSMSTRIQTIQIRCIGKIDFVGVNHLRLIALNIERTHLTSSAQLLIKKRLLFLDHSGFEQKRADFTCCTDRGYFFGLFQHARFICGTKMRHDARADIDTFSDVKRQAIG
jgi:hypothetical protein